MWVGNIIAIFVNVVNDNKRHTGGVSKFIVAGPDFVFCCMSEHVQFENITLKFTLSDYSN